MSKLSDVRFILGQVMYHLEELIDESGKVLTAEQADTLREFENKLQDLDDALSEKESGDGE